MIGGPKSSTAPDHHGRSGVLAYDSRRSTSTPASGHVAHFHDDVLVPATLARPASGWMQTGGFKGRHGEALGHLLATMQFLPRAYPGTKW
jgi:hypothetical protein